jgi:hypothetical protein
MNTKPEGTSLRDLLTNEAERERKAYKWSTVSLAIVGAVGLIWIVISASSVVRLERKSSELTEQIDRQTRELNSLRDQITSAHSEYRTISGTLDQAKQALSLAQQELTKVVAAKTDAQAKAQQALTAVANATQAIGKEEDRLGFVTSDQSGAVSYRGRDGETIDVKVHYYGKEARVSYDLDGAATNLTGESFSFVLNKSRHNPSKLVLKYGFDSRGGAYNLTIATSGGQKFETVLRPRGWSGEDSFIFYIL